MPLTKFKKLSGELKPWTVYIWEEGDLVKGSCYVATNELDEVFHCGREIVRDTEFQKPSSKKDKYIAASQVKTQLQNTLNALAWYGKDIMDKDGINPRKFQERELRSAITASGVFIDISYIKPVKKYPVKKIDHNKAKELGIS